MPEASQLPPFEAEWARCAPWLEAALAEGGGTHTLDDVLRDVADGTATFWPGKASAIITEWQHSPRKTALHGWLAGGNLEEIVTAMIPCIEAWGAAQGCTTFTIAGRKGWVRALKAAGYQSDHSICVKETGP